MESSPAVSIVIRTLNEAKKLGLVFEALRAQQLPPREVIVVDSGSLDHTVKIAEEHGAVIIHTAPDQFSYGRALNIGFAASKGKVLVALSGHAVPAHAEWLQNLVQNFCDPNVAAVSSRLIPSPGSPLHNYWLSLPFFVYRSFRRNRLWLFWNTATAYRKEIWERFPFDEDLPGCEDREWALRVIPKGFDVVYEPSSLVWHSHDESYSKFLRRVISIGSMSARIDRLNGAS